MYFLVVMQNGLRVCSVQIQHDHEKIHMPLLVLGNITRYNVARLYQVTATAVLTLNLNILFGARTRRHHSAQKTIL